MEAERESARSRAVRSHENGLARVYTPGRDLERFYDILHVLAMADRLQEKEIRTLGIATEARERGLKAARAGDLEQAMVLIENARDIYTLGDLSKEAITSAETFQSAAESYILYKFGDHAAALESMMTSLKLCEILAIEYGYPAEMRRVHLARNVARVCASAGEIGDALRIGTGLLQYIAGDEEAWPLPYEGPARRSHLDDAAALMILDQVLSEVVRLLDPQELAAKTYLLAVKEARDVLQSGTHAFQRAANCLTAGIAHVEANEDAFFDEAAAFFATGREALEFTWRELEKKFLRATVANP